MKRDYAASTKRVDYNVPMENGKIKTNQKIAASLESIQYVLKNKCQAVILITHLGRPDGKRNMELSLKSVRAELQTLLNRKVIFLEDCVGPEIELAVMEPKEGSVFLLENARFHLEEIINSEDGRMAYPEKVLEFRKSLRRLAEVYVNDSFASCHRAHSSMLGAYYEVRAAGFSLLKELEFFSKTFSMPERPFLAILGGIEMQEKLDLISVILDKVDEIIIAGGISYTFLEVCENMKIGNSLYFENLAREIPALMEKAKQFNVTIHFPLDFVTGDKMANDAEVCRATRGGIKKTHMGLDIGPNTIKEFSKIIRRAKILMWNGPMGSYEYEPFAVGTHAILEAVVDQTNAKGITLASGLRTIVALEKWNAMDKVTFVSTGTAATIELMKGRIMPGLDSLCDGDPNCRQQCDIFRTIRPQLENSPFGQVDVEMIKEERRNKKDGFQKIKEKGEERGEETADPDQQRIKEGPDEEDEENQSTGEEDGQGKKKGGRAFLDRMKFKPIWKKDKRSDQEGQGNEKGGGAFFDRLKFKKASGGKDPDQEERGTQGKSGKAFFDRLKFKKSEERDSEGEKGPDQENKDQTEND